MKNTFVKVLSFVMALMMVVGTFGTLAVFAAGECTHAGATVVGDPVPATCKDFGYTWKQCPDCGLVKTDYVAPTGVHVEVDFYPENASSEATCTTPGYKAGKKCRDCGIIIKNPEVDASKPVVGHAYGEGKRVDRVYCTDPVKVVYACKYCNVIDESRTIVLEPAGVHDMEDTFTIVSAPEYVCSATTLERDCKVCSYKESVTAGEKHSYSIIHDKKADRGNYCGPFLYYKECAYCGTRTDVEENPGYNTTHNATKVATMSDDVRNDPKFVEFNKTVGNKYMGLANGASIGNAATHSVADVTVYRCNVDGCGVYYEVVGEKTEHTLSYRTEGGVSEKLADKDCKTAVILVEYCTKKLDDNKDCPYKREVRVQSAAVKHEAKDPVVEIEADCDTTGKVVTKCKNCDAVLKTEYPAATGHDWDAYYYCTAAGVKVTTVSCVEGIYKTRTCKTDNCGAMDTITKILDPTGANGHVPSVGEDYKFQPATCVTNAYSYYYCKNSELCMGYHVKVAQSDVEGSKDTAPHVAYGTTVEGKNFVDLPGKTVAATCSATGTAYYYCVCGDELSRELPKLGHAVVTNGITDNDTTGVHVDSRFVEETCVTNGWKAGKHCSVCGEIIEAREYVAANPDKHYNPATDDLHDGTYSTYAGTEIPALKTNATCQAAGYQYFRFDACCDKVVEKKWANQLTTCASADIETKNFAAPECAKNGTHEYEVCKVCGTIQSIDLNLTECITAGMKCTAESHAILASRLASGELTVNDLAFAALGHEFTVEVARDPAKCVYNTATGTWYGVDGWSAYYKCTRYDACGAATAKTIEYAHERKTQEYSKVEATCTTDARNAGNYCPICVAIEGSDDYKLAYGKINEQTGQWEALAKKTDHNFGATAQITPVNCRGNVLNACKDIIDCEQAAYLYKTCANGCGRVEIIGESYVAPKAHNFAAVSDTHNAVFTENTALTTNDAGYACWVSGFTSRDCVVCEQKDDIVSKNDQIKHYYYVAGEKVDIDTSCKAIKAFDGVTCALCNLTVAADKDAGEYADGYIGADHKYVTDDNGFIKYDNVNKKWVATSCTEWGRISTYCTICKVEKSSETVAPKNPSVTPYDENNEIDTDVVAAILKEQAPTATEAGFITYVCAYCGLDHTYTIAATGFTTEIAVTLTPSTEIAVPGSALKLTIAVEAEALDFDILTIDLNATGVSFSNAKLVADFGDVNAIASVSKDGKLTIFTECDANGDVAYATIAGKVVLATVDVVVNAGVSGNIEFTVDDEAGVGEDVDSNEDYQTLTVENEKVTVKAAIRGDINGDTIIGYSDVRALIAVADKMDLNGEYDALYDVNNDNKVNDADYNDLLKFLQAGSTAGAYLELIGVDLDAELAAFNPDYLPAGVTMVEFVNLVYAMADNYGYEAYLTEVATRNIASVSAGLRLIAQYYSDLVA